MVQTGQLTFDEFYAHTYEKVKEFRTAMGLLVHTKMSEDDDTNHLALAVEELKELSDARSRAAKADAIVDLIYVHMGRRIQAGQYLPSMDSSGAYLIKVLWTLATTGYGWDLKALFDEVHRCNMTKFVLDEETAQNEKEILTSKGYEVDIINRAVGNQIYYVFVAASDVTFDDGKHVKKGKLLKPSTTEQPNFEGILV